MKHEFNKHRQPDREFRSRSEASVVKELVQKMKRRQGYNPGRWSISEKLGDEGFFDGNWPEAMKNAGRAIRRAKKKAAQPFRKNMKRKLMHRKAAGKNEVTRRR
jgi:hypothetical protein